MMWLTCKLQHLCYIDLGLGNKDLTPEIITATFSDIHTIGISFLQFSLVRLVWAFLFCFSVIAYRSFFVCSNVHTRISYFFLTFMFNYIIVELYINTILSLVWRQNRKKTDIKNPLKIYNNSTWDTGLLPKPWSVFLPSL